MKRVNLTKQKLLYLACFLAIVGIIAFKSFTHVDQSKPNVILVVIDALRADHLGCYGYSVRETSPAIDALAKQSYVFSNAFSASSWTRSAVASTLTGLSPLEHGILSENPQHILSEDIFTIQKFFKTKGYVTGAVVSNPHYAFGFLHQIDQAYIGADLNYDHAITWIDKQRHNPFFLLIHNNDPHDPYSLHEEFGFIQNVGLTDSEYDLKNLLPTRRDGAQIACNSPLNQPVILPNEALQKLIALYDGEIRFADHHFSRLMRYLKDTRLRDNTIVIVTSDHGEEFLDHGGYWHGCTLYDEVLHVPLIISLPGQNSGRVIDQNVGTIDLLPTLMHLVNGKLPQDRFTGKSLLPLIKGNHWSEKPIFSATQFRGPLQYSWINGDYKLIKYASGDIIGLFDLKRDPKETDNLKDTHPQLLRTLDQTLMSFVHHTADAKYTDYSNREQRDISTVPSASSSTLKEDLQSLGYVQ